MDVMKNTLRAQAMCLVLLLGMSMIVPSVLNSQQEEIEISYSDSETENHVKMVEDHGTRAVETYDWPMFHKDVFMTGAQDPIVTVPENNLSYTWNSGGDIEATPAVVGDWVFFGNGPGAGNSNTFYGLNETGGWSWNYSRIDNWAWRGSPAVADIPGIGLMVFSGHNGTAGNRFYGFDADPDDNNDGVIDGSDFDEGQIDLPGAQYDIIWEVILAGGSYRQSPLIVEITALGGNVIYIGTAAGVVHCFNAASGLSIWNWTDPSGDGFQYGHPTLGYDVNGNPEVFIINNGAATSTFYALDAIGFAGTTTVRWSTDLHGNDVLGGPAVAVGGPGEDDNRVFFATWDNPATLYCFDATPDDDGNGIPGNQFGSGDWDEGLPDPMGMPWDLLWSYILGGSDMYIASTPALSNGRVYIGTASSILSNNKLFVIEQNGTVNQTHIVWTYDAPGDIYYNSPAVADGKVIVSTGGNWGSAGLSVIFENNGSEVWYNSSAFSGGQVETSCAVAKGNIYIGGNDDLLHVFGGGSVINDPPDIPNLYSPLDTSYIITSDIILDWSDSIDPDGDSVSYIVEINDTNNFGIPAYGFSGIGTSHLEVILPDGPWFWRVRAEDEFGAKSDWSVVWNFTVDTFNDPPMIFVVSPNGGEIWNGVHLIYWEATDPEFENMTFTVWLSDNSGSSYDYLLASGLGTHSRNLDFDTTLWPEGTTYRTKVEARDSRGLFPFDVSDDDFTIDYSQPIYDEWPQYKHYANKTSYTPIDAPDTSSVDWISAPGYPFGSRSSPTVFQGHIYYGDTSNIWYSLNETDGSLEWKFQLHSTPDDAHASMAVSWIPAFNTYGVFGVSQTNDHYSFLLLDIDGLSDGDDGIVDSTIPYWAPGSWNSDILWAFYCDGQIEPSPPTVVDDLVYIWLNNDSSNQEILYAFDVNGLFDGDDESMGLNDTDYTSMADRVWEYELGNIATATTVADDKLFIALSFSGNPNLLAFDADPRDMVDEGIISDPGSAPYDQLWAIQVDGSIWGPPTYHNDTIWLTTFGTPNIYSINVSSSVTNWVATDISGFGDFFAAPSYWNDRIYVVSYNQNISCYDATPDDNGNGIGGTLPGSGDTDEGYTDPFGVPYDLIWNFNPPGTQRGTPAIADGKVFVPAYSTGGWGNLYALDAIGNGDGTTDVIWSYYHDGGEFYAGPAVANGYVYQSTEDGEIFKFGVPTNPDLAVFHEDIMFDPQTPGNNNTWVDITVRVSNLAPVIALAPLLRIIIDANDNGQYDSGETIIYNATISNIPGYKEVLLTVPWFGSPVDYYDFIVEVDPLDTITEPFNSNNLAWNFYAVDIFDTVDYIIINDTAIQGGNWVGDTDYNIGETDTFYAHGFNITGGYLGLVEVTWSSNDSAVGSVIAGPGSSTIFSADSAGYCRVTATYVLNPSITNDTGSLHVLDWTVDYITIVDTQGTGSSEILDQTVTLGFTISGIAAAFNNTAGYLGDITVSWDVFNSGSAAFTNPPSGESSTFDAASTPGVATWEADDGKGHIDTVVFTITDYTVDYITIVDTQGTGSSEIPDQTVDVGFTIDGWAAAFNTSVGYLGDISVTWTVNNIGTSASTNPSSGINSTFDAGSDGGSAQWIADDGSGHIDYVNFTINSPTVDFITIVDSPGTGSSEIPDQIVDVRFTIQGWAAGFNTTAGYIGDVVVSWVVINTGSTAFTSPSLGVQSTFNASDSGGDATWIAELSPGVTDTVLFTINPPTVDYITIVDTPGIGINEIQDQTVSLNVQVNGWAAGFNNSVGYVSDISVTWSVVNSGGASASTNPTSGVNSTFNSGVSAGTASWRASGSGHLDTVEFTIIDVTVDYITIVDTSGTGNTEIPNQNVDVGYSIAGYAAAFNDTSGYIGDISVTWTVSNVSSTAYTTPSSGTSSTFYADVNGGTANWTADDSSGHTDSVIFTINPPTRDYIMIVDSPGIGSTEIPNLNVSVGFTIQGWAAAFNNTIGYLGDVTVTWSVLNDGTTNATTNPIILSSTSTFHSGWNMGNATWFADDGTNVDSVVFTISPPTVDYIRIVDTQGSGSAEITNQTVNVGFSITGWAAGFNNSAGYVGDVIVDWSLLNSGTNASTNPPSDYSSDFYSGWLGGTVTWTADDLMGHTDLVIFTVNPPEVDYIRIVDSQGTGISEIPDQTIDIGFTQPAWAASYNLTIGYLGDVTVAWIVENLNTNATTSDPSGPGSIFSSGWQEGIANWTIDDGMGHSDLVTFTVNPPSIDYILIVDTPDLGASEIIDQTVNVGITISGWAASFNNIAGYIGDVNVTWSVTNFGANTQTNPLSGFNSIFNAGNAQGSASWKADDGNGHTDTVTISVNPPFVEYIQIRDAPNGGGNVVEDPIYPVGHTTTFYGALMNATAGFIDNAPSSSLWSSTNESIVTVTTPGESTNLACAIQSYGTITITIDDASGHLNSTTVTVLAPTTDELRIMDSPGGLGSEITSPDYPVGAEDTYYGAMFNDTAGYIGDVPSGASWSSNHPRVEVTPFGTSTDLECSDTNSGTATITLNDGDGHTESVTVTIQEPTIDSIKILNSPDPSGSEIIDHTINPGDSETYYALGFNATAGDLGSVEVDWSVSDFSIGSLSSSQGLQTTLSVFLDKVGLITVSAKYENLDASTFIVTVIDNIPPEADAGSDTVAEIAETVHFDGTDSTDNVGIESYIWTFDYQDEPVTLNGRNPSFEFLKAGTYEITLEVIDAAGNSDTDTFSVVVEGGEEEVEDNPFILSILLIIIVIVVLLLLFYLMGRKKKKQECRICGNEFSPQSEAEAKQSMCANCAKQGVFGGEEASSEGAKQATSLPPPPPSQRTQSKSVKIKCPDCGSEFDVQPQEGGITTVICPHCGTKGQMEL
jgi:hypothetical protein